MFDWFKRKGRPAVGPDYRHIDSREKAEALCRRGELQKLWLLPAEFGGEDIPPNIVYVPPFAAELKQRLDQNTILSMARSGHVSRYNASPEYEGKSVVPSRIRIAATDPGRFEGAIAIWGDAVRQASEPRVHVPAGEAPVFGLDESAVVAAEPDAVVRAFIADYEIWNRYASEVHKRDAAAGMADAESAYARLLTKYCPPGLVAQPVAFGNPPAHGAADEAVVRVDSAGDAAVVTTLRTREIGTVVMTADYEYHLKKRDGRWYLVSVLYVDADGKYESL